MVRLGALLLAGAAAVATPRGCAAPRAQVTALRMPGSKPELALLRCQVAGLRGKLTYEWKLGAAVHQVGYGLPRDEGAMLVSLNDNPSPPGLTAKCTASASDGAAPAAMISAGTSLAPLTIRSVTPPKIADQPLVIEGSGFGSTRGNDAAIYLLSARGEKLRADSECKQAAWADGKVAVCLPAPLAGAFEVRVQSGGRLAIAPGAPLRLDLVAPVNARVKK